jgi:hypothetical protein
MTQTGLKMSEVSESVVSESAGDVIVMSSRYQDVSLFD